MQMLALIQAADHVCYRYRIKAFERALAQRGLTLRADPIERGTLRRIRQLRAAGQVDVVILQRKLLPLWQLRILRRAARCLIYDVDDAVFLRDSFHRKPPASFQRLARFWATVYAADAITAGNGYLRDRVASYVEPGRVRLIPTCVEPEQYPTARHHRVGSAIRLVWIGQQATLPSLACAGRHLRAAADRVAGLTLRVICDRFPDLAGVQVEPCRWSSATEAVDLAGADIGIAWLPDDQWSRGKCGLKVLQYMAAGLPVVANPVGMNRQMVLQGQTGMLASTPAEWGAAIRRLAYDPRLRRRMGAAGRELVERQFSVACWGAEFAGVAVQTAGRAGLESCRGATFAGTGPGLGSDPQLDPRSPLPSSAGRRLCDKVVNG